MILLAEINKTMIIYPLKMCSFTIDFHTLKQEAVSLFFEGRGD